MTDELEGMSNDGLAEEVRRLRSVLTTEDGDPRVAAAKVKLLAAKAAIQSPDVECSGELDRKSGLIVHKGDCPFHDPTKLEVLSEAKEELRLARLFWRAREQVAGRRGGVGLTEVAMLMPNGTLSTRESADSVPAIIMQIAALADLHDDGEDVTVKAHGLSKALALAEKGKTAEVVDISAQDGVG